MARTLTFSGLSTIKVNNVTVTSPYTINDGDVITATKNASGFSGGKIEVKVNNVTQYTVTGTTQTYSIANGDINLVGSTAYGSRTAANVTINFAEVTPFYIEAIENTTITLNRNGVISVSGIKYGINTTTPSTSYTLGSNITLSAGDKAYWEIPSITTDFTNFDYLYFTSTGNINAGGSLRSLIGYEDKVPRNRCFTHLFLECETLISAENLEFPYDTNNKTSSYGGMFMACINLKKPPRSLSAIMGEESCSYMFNGCYSMETPPLLPATVVGSFCYYGMFIGCNAMKYAPELPATTLAEGCYCLMFYGCVSIKQPCNLPATTLAYGCYQSMFKKCSSIKISSNEYSIFKTPYRIPSSGTGTVGDDSVSEMFYNCGGEWENFNGTPVINRTYYLDTSGGGEANVSVIYNGETITSFSSGSKTLKCGGKVMESDVVVEIGD